MHHALNDLIRESRALNSDEGFFSRVRTPSVGLVTVTGAMPVEEHTTGRRLGFRQLAGLLAFSLILNIPLAIHHLWH